MEDIAAIREMADIVFRETYKGILSPEQMEYMMDWMYSESSLFRQMTELGHVFFIEDGKGYVSFRRDWEAGRHTSGEDDSFAGGTLVFHLEKLYVLPQFQKTGLGQQLFNKVIEEVHLLTDGSPARIELNVNRANPSVSFYEKQGMYKTRSGDFPIGKGFYMNDYIMAIEI